MENEADDVGHRSLIDDANEDPEFTTALSTRSCCQMMIDMRGISYILEQFTKVSSAIFGAVENGFLIPPFALTDSDGTT